MYKKVVGIYYHANHFANNMMPIIEHLRRYHYEFYLINLLDNRLEREYPYLKNHSLNWFVLKIYVIIKRMRSIPFIGNFAYLIALHIWLKYKISKINLDIMIFSDDRTILSCIILKVCNKLKIKSILYPVESFQSKRARIAEKLQHKKIYKNQFHVKIASIIFPNNFEISNSGIVYWYKPSIAIPGRLLNILSMNPWIRGGNSIDLIAVQSVQQLKENLRLKMPLNKQFLTGFPPHDYLYNEKLGATQKDYNTTIKNDIRKSALIVGTTYYQIDKNRDLNYLYLETKQIVEIIIQELSPQYKIIFKLHPRENLEMHKEIIGDELVKQIDFLDPLYNIYKLLKESDFIFVNLSSTVIGALCNDCPIIAYNLGGAKHFDSFYRDFKSIKTVHNLSELKRIIRAYNNNPIFLSENKAKRLEDRKMFGCFDGKNTERFIELFDRS